MSMASGWIIASISQKSLMKLRKELFEHLQTLSIGYFDQKSAGDLMSRLTNDIDAINGALTQNVTQLISMGITLIGVIVAMFILNWRLALATLIVFPIMIWFTAAIGARIRDSFRGLQRNLGLLNSVMQETISGQRVVIAFEQQETVNKRFSAANQEVKKIGIKAMTYAMWIPSLMGVLSNANIAIVAGVGGWMVLMGTSSIGTIAAFISYSRQFANPLRQIGNVYNSIQSALAGAERIFEVIDTKPELEDAPDAVRVKEFAGAVEFKNVNFSYLQNVPVLNQSKGRTRTNDSARWANRCRQDDHR
jgi:ATP-binding cassette subfamily B multidrug efflux pump